MSVERSMQAVEASGMSRSAWSKASLLGTYENCMPSITPMSQQHHKWQELQQQLQPGPASKQLEQEGARAGELQGSVFEQVLPGESLRRDRHHVFIGGQVSIPDAAVLQLSEHAQRIASSGLAESGMSDAKLLAVDALYKLEPALCAKLNEHLQQSSFGPFEHVGSAVFRLLQLRRAGKADKAQQLESLLSEFASANHGSMECLLQWPELLRLKKERDAFAHPLDIPRLQSMVAEQHSDLANVTGALTMLMKTSGTTGAGETKTD